MKVKHALGVGLLSTFVLGAGVIYVSAGDKRVDWVTSAYVAKEYGFDNTFVAKTIEDGKYRDYKYQTPNGVEFTIHTKVGLLPDVVSDTYSISVAKETFLAGVYKLNPHLKVLGFKVDVPSVRVGVSDKGEKYILVKLLSDRDMSIFGLDDESYDSLYEAITLLSPLSDVDGYTLAVDFDDGNDGVVRFVGLDKFTTPDSVKSFVYESVQSQLGSSDDSKGNK